MEYIPKDKLEKGKYYEIKARNFNVGKWDGEGFIGKRTKFNYTFMFKEYHWDDGPPYGTVKPIRQL